MKKILLIISFFAVAILNLSAQRIVTTAALNLRTSPTSKSQSYGKIPEGDEVTLLSYKKGEQWCYVSYAGYQGYVSVNYLHQEEDTSYEYEPVDNEGTRYTATEEDDDEIVTSPTSGVHYYNNVDDNIIQAPTRYPVQPQGATAVCIDGTYSFSQHAKGTCSKHGGVYQWLSR
jgi:uncharacterized protein YraI